MIHDIHNTMNDESTGTELVTTGDRSVQLTQRTTIDDLEHNFKLAIRQRELLKAYIKEQLVEGKHFYQIDGGKKSLNKEGAEIILLPHGYTPDYEIISGPPAPPEDDKPYQITVKCILRKKGDWNSFVGSGIGSAGSMKSKNTVEGMIYVPRQTDRYLCHNATLKMAQKSAKISATIDSTAASEFFTQDIYANEGNANDPDERSNAPRASGPPRGSTPPPTGPTASPPGIANRAPVASGEEWRTFPMPWGKQSGKLLGQLDKKYLFGLYANYVVETTYQGKPCRPDKIAKDQKLRDMLDAAGKHYKFDRPKGEEQSDNDGGDYDPNEDDPPSDHYDT